MFGDLISKIFIENALKVLNSLDLDKKGGADRAQIEGWIIRAGAILSKAAGVFNLPLLVKICEEISKTINAELAKEVWGEASALYNEVMAYIEDVKVNLAPPAPKEEPKK